MENNIQRVPDTEAEALPRMAEIRFDCVVTMYEMCRMQTESGFMGTTERKSPPQWFRNVSKITLESIKYTDEYTLGRMLKDMLRQLELHIEKYDNNNNNM